MPVQQRRILDGDEEYIILGGILDGSTSNTQTQFRRTRIISKRQTQQKICPNMKLDLEGSGAEHLAVPTDVLITSTGYETDYRVIRETTKKIQIYYLKCSNRGETKRRN